MMFVALSVCFILFPGELNNIHAVLKTKIIQKLKSLLGDSYDNYSLVLKNSSTSYGNGYGKIIYLSFMFIYVCIS